MNVRQAVIGDEALLRRFRAEALTIEPYALGSTYDRELARTIEDWQRWIASGVVFILEAADGARGMAAAAHQPADHAIVQLTTMWVQPDARGYGGADALVTAVVGWAQSERARAVHLQVAHDNLRARRFFERNGLKVTGGMRVGERDEAIELHMERVVAKYHDDSAQPSNPGNVRLAPGRLAPWRGDSLLDSLINRIAPRLIGDEFAAKVDEHLRLGDSRAAVVVSVSGLLVAAYTDELDCVVMLRFPQEFVGRFALSVDSRLLTVNTYLKRPGVAPDLIPGPGAVDDWQNVNPLIADFLSEDSDRIAEGKAEIDEAEWELCALLGREYLRLRPGVARDGSPYECTRPAPTEDADSRS